MEIIGSDTFIYMMYDKELLYMFDYFNTDYKNGSDQKTCKCTFFHEKSERLKSPPNGHFLFARYSFPNGNKK